MELERTHRSQTPTKVALAFQKIRDLFLVSRIWSWSFTNWRHFFLCPSPTHKESVMETCSLLPKKCQPESQSLKTDPQKKEMNMITILSRWEGNVRHLLYNHYLWNILINLFYLFGVLRRFQHCTGHITTGSWKGRGNQYIQLVTVLYCKLPTNGKQLPAFPLEAVPGTEPRPQRC